MIPFEREEITAQRLALCLVVTSRPVLAKGRLAQPHDWAVSMPETLVQKPGQDIHISEEMIGTIGLLAAKCIFRQCGSHGGIQEVDKTQDAVGLTTSANIATRTPNVFAT